MKYVNGRFFNRIQGDQKAEMVGLAKSVKCSGDYAALNCRCLLQRRFTPFYIPTIPPPGFTNYEAPLDRVLSEFETNKGGGTHSYGRGSSANRHILFLTDGIPTQVLHTCLIRGICCINTWQPYRVRPRPSWSSWRGIGLGWRSIPSSLGSETTTPRPF